MWVQHQAPADSPSGNNLRCRGSLNGVKNRERLGNGIPVVQFEASHNKILTFPNTKDEDGLQFSTTVIECIAHAQRV
jgi:hypothetical protein